MCCLSLSTVCCLSLSSVLLEFEYSVNWLSSSCIAVHQVDNSLPLLDSWTSDRLS